MQILGGDMKNRGGKKKKARKLRHRFPTMFLSPSPRFRYQRHLGIKKKKKERSKIK